MPGGNQWSACRDSRIRKKAAYKIFIPYESPRSVSAQRHEHASGKIAVFRFSPMRTVPRKRRSFAWPCSLDHLLEAFPKVYFEIYVDVVFSRRPAGSSADLRALGSIRTRRTIFSSTPCSHMYTQAATEPRVLSRAIPSFTM